MVRRWIFSLFLMVTGALGFVNCEGGSAAPTGGTSTPVAVELPKAAQFDLITFDGSTFE